MLIARAVAGAQPLQLPRRAARLVRSLSSVATAASGRHAPPPTPPTSPLLRRIVVAALSAVGVGAGSLHFVANYPALRGALESALPDVPWGRAVDFYYAVRYFNAPPYDPNAAAAAEDATDAAAASSARVAAASLNSEACAALVAHVGEILESFETSLKSAEKSDALDRAVEALRSRVAAIREKLPATEKEFAEKIAAALAKSRHVHLNDLLAEKAALRKVMDKMRAAAESEIATREAAFKDRLRLAELEHERLIEKGVAARLDAERSGRLARLEHLAQVTRRNTLEIADTCADVERAHALRQLSTTVRALMAAICAAPGSHLSAGLESSAWTALREFARSVVHRGDAGAGSSSVDQTKMNNKSSDKAGSSLHFIDAALEMLPQSGQAAPPTLGELRLHFAMELEPRLRDCAILNPFLESLHSISDYAGALNTRLMHAIRFPGPSAADADPGTAGKQDQDQIAPKKPVQFLRDELLDIGTCSYLVSKILSKIMPDSMHPKNGVLDTVKKARHHLANDDLDGAAREINSLRGWPKIVSRRWLEQARTHLAVRQALDTIDTYLSFEAIMSP